jgi:hypothetical protein
MNCSIMREHVLQLNDENREGMAKYLSKYIHKYKGNDAYFWIYKDQDHEITLEGNGIIPTYLIQPFIKREMSWV